jgi:hypothetical protein
MIMSAETTLTLLAQLCDRTDATFGRCGGGWHLELQFLKRGSVAWTDESLERLVRRGLLVVELWSEIDRLGDEESARLEARLEALRLNHFA